MTTLDNSEIVEVNELIVFRAACLDVNNCGMDAWNQLSAADQASAAEGYCRGGYEEYGKGRYIECGISKSK